MPQSSNVGYTVLGTISTNPKEWMLGPKAHFEIDYLDHDGQHRRLVVYAVKVLRSGDSELVLGCQRDEPGFGRQKHVALRMELRFKYSARTQKWALILTTLGAVRESSERFLWLARLLWAWRVLLTIIAGLLVAKFVSDTLSATSLAACFFWIGIGLALSHGLAILVVPKDLPDVRKLRRVSWSGYVLASLAVVVQVFLSLQKY